MSLIFSVLPEPPPITPAHPLARAGLCSAFHSGPTPYMHLQWLDLASRAAHVSAAGGKVVELEQVEHAVEPDFRLRAAFFEICYPAGLQWEPNLVRSIRTAWKLQMAT